MSLSNPSLPNFRAQEALSKRRQKDCKSNGNGRQHGNRAFETQQNGCTYELTETEQYAQACISLNKVLELTE